jgi:hypothetical protein
MTEIGGIMTDANSALVCPQCSLGDQVQAVPVAYELGVTDYAGTSSGSGTAVGFGISGTGVPVSGIGVSRTATQHSGTMVNRLAAQLMPAPERKRVFSGQAIRRFIALWFLLGILGAGLSFVSPVFEVLEGVIIWSIAAFGVYAAVVRSRRNARVKRGRPAALALWRTGWLCHRCGGVFVPKTSVTPSTPTEMAGSLVSVAEFRAQVWTAGGYADLLGKE